MMDTGVNNFVITLSILNTAICLLVALYTAIKVNSLKHEVVILRDILYDKRLIKNTDIKIAEMDYQEEHPSIINKFFQLNYDFGDEDEWDDSPSSKVVKFKEKQDKNTEDIIATIDYYEAEFNLNRRFCKDVRDGKFKSLTEEDLVKLSHKYDIDDIANSVAKPTYKTQPLKVDVPIKSAANIPRTRHMFVSPQEMVNYVAGKSRMVYDKKLGIPIRVHSFDIDDYGELLIFYDNNTVPKIFKAFEYGEAS